MNLLCTLVMTKKGFTTNSWACLRLVMVLGCVVLEPQTPVTLLWALNILVSDFL